ncbi:hypothetical protein [Polaromonas sp. UC242_47]|uniref:hypothetical protein n=1 Tax=Polaromonas sp. UC242_47 TaxID=3374626 RepID=UPI0037885762
MGAEQAFDPAVAVQQNAHGKTHGQQKIVQPEQTHHRVVARGQLHEAGVDGEVEGHHGKQAAYADVGQLEGVDRKFAVFVDSVQPEDQQRTNSGTKIVASRLFCLRLTTSAAFTRVFSSPRQALTASLDNSTRPTD